eukprot:9039049-Pyramimonas_sp.AAC.1
MGLAIARNDALLQQLTPSPARQGVAPPDQQQPRAPCIFLSAANSFYAYIDPSFVASTPVPKPFPQPFM